jgi:hypothetical protein
MGYSQFFVESHREKLLNPIADLVAAIREQDILVWCLEDFSEEHVAITGTRSSCAVIASDKIPNRAIILNYNQVQHYGSVCDLSIRLTLLGVTSHELSHIHLLDKFGIEAALSEYDVWDCVERLNILHPGDFRNLRNFAMHQKQPSVEHRKSEQAPEWLKSFDQLSPQLGYGFAWQVALKMATDGGLKSWDITSLLIENGWSTEAAIDVVDTDRTNIGLSQLALDRKDFEEMKRCRKQQS